MNKTREIKQTSIIFELFQTSIIRWKVLFLFFFFFFEIYFRPEFWRVRSSPSRPVGRRSLEIRIFVRFVFHTLRAKLFFVFFASSLDFRLWFLPFVRLHYAHTRAHTRHKYLHSATFAYCIIRPSAFTGRRRESP